MTCRSHLWAHPAGMRHSSHDHCLRLCRLLPEGGTFILEGELGTWFGPRLTLTTQIGEASAGWQASASNLNTVDCSAGLAESLQDEADLVAQTCFGILTVLNTVLDQNRME